MAVIEGSGFQLLPHPPYSPDLAPSDFYLFRHLKKHLRGEKFENPDDLRENVVTFLGEQSKNFYKNAFLELVERWKKCIENGGSYVEK